MKKFTCNPNIIDEKLKIALSLRSLYADAGFSYYESSEFESYDFYREHQDFLVCGNIITFNDTNGALMSLRPDMTLCIINSPFLAHNKQNKVYYDGDIYRVSSFTGRYKCYRQLGVECFGDIKDKDVEGVFNLALASLSTLSNSFALAFSDTRLISKFISTLHLSKAEAANFIKMFQSKNKDGLVDMLKSKRINYNYIVAMRTLIDFPSGTLASCEKELLNICKTMGIEDEANCFKSLLGWIKKGPWAKNVQMDFSLIGDLNYYSGLYFNGFINTIGEAVLSGGQYDKLLEKMNKSGKAVGFGVNIDALGGAIC